MHKILYNSQGAALQLGQQLGKGGEGVVYEVQDVSDKVAKIYHNPADAKRIAKLAGMVTAATPKLVEVAAWPTDVLREKPNGIVKGLLMPKVKKDYREIHHLYGPAARKRDFPKADWAFLIHTAKNVAIIFDIIHSYGHVIGDVNQGNILVNAKAECKLIDCDSFQITSGGTTYSCEVGVPMFTPPELQNRPFAGSVRTQNHDNFGLALLCFHLLFMGRHPFAGKYAGKEDMPIDRAIREFRFAYSVAAASKQMTPPPNVLGMDSIPYRLRNLFERAFNDASAQSAVRPTPREWIQELDTLQTGLRTCNQNPIHKYLSTLGSCPWCKLEQSSGIFFFLSKVSVVVGDAFDLNQVWGLIQAVQPLSVGSLPIQVPRNLVKPAPLPPQQGGFWGLVFSIFSDPDAEEFSRRRRALEQAQREWENAQNTWRNKRWNQAFQKQLKKLEGLRQEWENLRASYDREKEQAVLNAYLDRFLIEDAHIPGVGEKLTLTLQVWGVETAADVSYAHISAVDGFGPKRTADLLAWRTGLETSFRRLPQAQRNIPTLQLDQQYAQKRLQLERSLRNGPEALKETNKQIIQKQERFLQECLPIAQRLAQAEADASAMR